ncbi:MAG: hypothetical protein L0Z63_08860 [Actinobacteria bacterium]|nr:hypothetical protein [Actinomycetota bacterium]
MSKARRLGLGLLLLGACTTTSDGGLETPPVGTTADVVSSTTIGQPASFAAQAGESPGLGWEAIVLPDDVGGGTVAWTGEEIIFWGCEITGTHVYRGDPGMAYNPVARVWRQLPFSGKSPVFGVASVWTGSELFLCCGDSRDAVAYSPRTDTWRALAPAPITGARTSAVWTGEQVLVVGRSGVAGYSPSANTWVEYDAPPVPLGWTNEVVWADGLLVIWPSTVERVVHRGAALDPETGDWSTLPDPPAWPAAPSMVWTGAEVMIWGGLPAAVSDESERGVGSALDLTTMTWRRLPEALPEPDPYEGNLGSQTLLWTGNGALVMTGALGTGADEGRSLALIYEPTSDAWRYLGGFGVGVWWASNATVAGESVAVVGERHLYLSPAGWTPDGVPVPEGGVPVADPSQSPADATRDGVIPELAAVPSWLRVSQVPEQFGATRLVTDEGTWLVSETHNSLSSDPDGCTLGGHDTRYGSERICVTEYTEILLLDDDSEILRAYPFPSFPVHELVVTDEAVYCRRQGDGGLPDSMLCRIDRETLEAVVRVFPFEGTSDDVSWLDYPDYWVIDGPTEHVLWEAFEITEDTVTISGWSGSATVDPQTLELIDVDLEPQP